MTTDTMTTDTIELTEDGEATILDNLRGTRDAMKVSRVFGEPYEMKGVTVIPVASVSAGAGGGGGEGTGDDDESGSGFGTGFGLGARPVGVYQVHEGSVEWTPALDLTRVVRGAQVLAGIIAVCVALVKIMGRS